MGDRSEKMDPQNSCIDFIIRFAIDSMKLFLKLNPSKEWGTKFLPFESAVLVISIFSFRIENHQSELKELE